MSALARTMALVAIVAVSAISPAMAETPSVPTPAIGAPQVGQTYVVRRTTTTAPGTSEQRVTIEIVEQLVLARDGDRVTVHNRWGSLSKIGVPPDSPENTTTYDHFFSVATSLARSFDNRPLLTKLSCAPGALEQFFPIGRASPVTIACHFAISRDGHETDHPITVTLTDEGTAVFKLGSADIPVHRVRVRSKQDGGDSSDSLYEVAGDAGLPLSLNRTMRKGDQVRATEQYQVIRIE